VGAFSPMPPANTSVSRPPSAAANALIHFFAWQQTSATASAARLSCLSPLSKSRPGEEKTHLAVALAETAIQSGQAAHFVTAHDLVTDLGRAYREGRLDRRLRIYLAPKVLIIDEMGLPAAG
jgi:hypothetical protein